MADLPQININTGPQGPAAKTSRSTTSRRGELAPRQLENVQQQRELTDQQQATTQRAGEIDIVEARAQFEAQKSQLEQLTKQRNALSQIAERSQAEMAQREQSLRQAQEKFRQTKFTDFFSNQSTAQNVLNLIGAAVGGAFLPFTGGKNLFLERLQTKINQDFERQKQNAALQAKALAQQTGNLDRSRKMLADQLKMLELKQSALEGQTAQLLKVIAARAGVPRAQIAASEGVQKLERSQLEREAKVFQAEQRDVSSTVSKTVSQFAGGAGAGDPPKKSQTDALQRAGSLLQDLQVLQGNPDLTSKALSKIQETEELATATKETAESGILGAGLARGARFLGAPRSASEGLTPEEQGIANARANIADLMGRARSGAAIGVKEGARFTDIFVPQPGDAPATIKQKINRLTRFIEGDLNAAGNIPGGQELQQELQDLTGGAGGGQRGSTGGGRKKSGGASAGPRRVRLKDGRTGTLFSDGTFEPD